MESKTLHERLVEIQQTLKAPKAQKNTFGNYYYRSCEDILEAVKPLLKDLHLILSDEVVNVGAFNYVKATAILSNGDAVIEVSAFARESIDRKGMDDAQITGSASSYARKYALNGLFAIDDTKDADTMDNTKETQPKAKEITREPVKGACDHSAGYIEKMAHTPQNAGRMFKTCKSCNAFLGWIAPKVETKEEPEEPSKYEKDIVNF